MKTRQWTLGAALACAALIGCEKSSETQQREADRAAAEADKLKAEGASEADSKELREAQEKADKERGELHDRVVREKSDYHARIQRAIADVETDLADHKVDVTQIRRGDRSKDQKTYGAVPAKDFDAVEALLIRRDRLLDHADKIDSTLDNDWPALKRDIESELEAKGRVKPGRT